jgi:tetratricopeptide (TPR) repeat protein
MKKTLSALSIAFAILFPAAAAANNLYFFSDCDIKNSGMSGSYAPFTSGSFSPFTNPAGLGSAETQELGLMYYNLFEGAVVDCVTYAYPIIDKGTLSVSGIMLDNGSIEQRDANNVLTGTFTDTYKALYLSYGINILQLMDVGVNARYINHDFYNISVSGFGIDAGTIVFLPYGTKLSLYAGDLLQPEFRYSSTADALPLYYDATLGWEQEVLSQISGILRVAAGFSGEEYDSTVNLHCGAEFSAYKFASVRLGVSGTGFTCGASLKYSGAEFNYALVQSSLDLVHRFSITYDFGENVRSIEKQLSTKEAKAKFELIEKIKTETVSKYEEEVEDFIKSGDYSNALISIQKALVWAPADKWFTEKEGEVQALMNTEKVRNYIDDADSLVRQDLYIDALVSLKNALDIDPKNEIASAKMARAQELIKTLGEKNLSVEEGNKTAIKEHFESGLNDYTAGNYEKAVEEWDKVIKASPLQRQVYNYIQRAQEKIKVKEDAAVAKKSDAEKKLASLYSDAVLLYTKGEFEKSIGLWREYLKLDPDNRDAKEYVEKITKEFLELQKQKLEW